MRKRDIKLGKYYYVVNLIKDLYSLLDLPIVRFKYTKDLNITNSKNIFDSYEKAKKYALKDLKKFIKKQKRLINKPKIYKVRKTGNSLMDSFTSIIREIG